MPNARVERRLTAILAADVAGYSRLMGADEEGTLSKLKAHRLALVDRKIIEHGGRIVKTTGDGLLVQFASVVDAVRCALEVQRGMVERNADVPQEKRVEFRIGVNVGDIIFEDEDAVDADTVRRVAHLARIAVADDEVEPLAGELNAILAFVEQLAEVDVAEVEPMTSVVPMAMKMRDDAITDGGIADDILANAPAQEDHFFLVPKVVE